MKYLRRMVYAVIVIYVLMVLAAYLFQTNLIFFPTKLPVQHSFRVHDGLEEVFLDTPDGEKINALFFPSASKRVILYFHGNAGCLESWQYVWDDLKSTGYS